MQMIPEILKGTSVRNQECQKPRIEDKKEGISDGTGSPFIGGIESEEFWSSDSCTPPVGLIYEATTWNELLAQHDFCCCHNPPYGC